MGELSKSDAEGKRDNYVKHLQKLIKDINEDYSEMDFENAMEKDGRSGSDVFSNVENITSRLNEYITELNNLTFE